jgi:hypothetical protein
MNTTDPTPSQVLAALRDHGVDVRTYDKWDTIGRPWRTPEDPNGPGGLYGVVNHHTATASASVTNPAPSLEWCARAFARPAANMLVGKTPGNTWLISSGSCWHPGDGGPFPAIGINGTGNMGYYRLFGIEVDDPGVKVGSITDYQIEQVGRINAALWDLCNWPDAKRIITHKCWTDGCHDVNSKGPSPWVGRKNDTIDGQWRQYPGNPKPEMYNAPFWRENAAQYRAKQPTWDGTVPMVSAVQKSEQTEGTANKAAWRVACRLFDLGYKKSAPAAVGKQTYPRQAVIRFREKQGWDAKDGAYGERVSKRLFNKAK